MPYRRQAFWAFEGQIYHTMVSLGMVYSDQSSAFTPVIREMSIGRSCWRSVVWSPYKINGKTGSQVDSAISGATPCLPGIRCSALYFPPQDAWSRLCHIHENTGKGSIYHWELPCRATWGHGEYENIYDPFVLESCFNTLSVIDLPSRWCHLPL